MISQYLLFQDQAKEVERTQWRLEKVGLESEYKLKQR